MKTHKRFVEIIALVVLVCFGLIAMEWSYRQPRTAAFTMDSPTVMLPRDGLLNLERFPDFPAVYRWSVGHSTLKAPNPGGVTTLQIVLAGGPGRTIPVSLQVGSTTYSFPVRPEPHFYTLMLPAATGERLLLTIDAPVYQAANRELGVVVSNLEISGGGLAPPVLLIAILCATVAGYLLLRRAGLSPAIASVGLCALQVLVALWMHSGGWRYSLCGALLLGVAGASLAAIVVEHFWTPVPHPQVARARWTSVDSLVIALLILLALGLRLLFLTASDPVGDLELAARRLGSLHAQGLAGAYMNDGDYVPLRLYILQALSRFVLPLGGGFGAPVPSPTLVLIKLPQLLADLATIPLLYAVMRRRWTVRRSALVTALYTFAPPVWINVAWWGQVDTLLMLPLILMVLLLDRAGGRWSWVCWIIALLIKPQAIVFAPLLYIATLRRYGTRGLLEGGVLAVGIFILACVPLVAVGQGPGLAQAYIGSVGRYHELTNRAYNLWYLALASPRGGSLGEGLGPLSYDAVGLLLMAAIALLIGLGLLQRADEPARIEAAAVLALGFFVLPTQIHERYLFLSLPFLILCAVEDPRILVVFITLVVTATINIFGALPGFGPRIHALIVASPLPVICAVVNLVVLILMMGHFLLMTAQPIHGRRRLLGWLRQRPTA